MHQVQLKGFYRQWNIRSSVSAFMLQKMLPQLSGYSLTFMPLTVEQDYPVPAAPERYNSDWFQTQPDTCPAQQYCIRT